MENLKKKIQSAVVSYKSGNLTEAESVTKNLIKENPKVVFLYNLLGLILADQKKIEEAQKIYEEGIRIDPKFPMLYINLGNLFFRLKKEKNINKAENLYKKSISLDGKLPEPHNNLGNLYNSANKHKEAIKSYKEAINLNPKFSIAHHNLASLYVTTGELKKAIVHFKDAINLNPALSIAHRGLSRLKKYNNKKDEHLLLLKERYNLTSEKNLEDKIELCFALGKAYEDIKDFKNSFLYYKEANFTYKKKINFNLEKEKERFINIKDTFNEKLFNKYQNVGFENTSPIFIVGLPRSGTTLVEQMLSNHPNVFGGDELNFIPKIIDENFRNYDLSLYFKEIVNFNQNRFKEIGADYVKRIKEISNNSNKITDKLPSNFLWVGFIKLILPKATIIHCSRNSKDNCISIFKNHFTSGEVKFGYDLNDIVEYYNLYYDLMKYWNVLLPDFIHNIVYEDLVKNTKKELVKLLSKCNLNWDDKCLSFYENKRPIKTASNTQAREKIYSTSVKSWKKYEKDVSEYFQKLVS